MSLRNQLMMLQHSDSFFPSGASSWSWGIETLSTDFKKDFKLRQRRKHISNLPSETNKVMIEEFVLSQLKRRWYVFDAIFIIEAWKSVDDFAKLTELDQQVHQYTLVNEARQGSVKLGQTLLKIYSEIPMSHTWLESIRNKQTYGHQCVVQGAIYASLKMTIEQSLLTAGHGFITNLVSSAIRLGLIGYLESQQIIQNGHELLAELLSETLPSFQDLSTFNPMAEIAMMRHEQQQVRLFSN